ncbi:MAG: hypothetical protein JWQ08_1282 [Deinococcus sp.]|nr:hypothetical protein [Deinococcus sp.]
MTQTRRTALTLLALSFAASAQAKPTPWVMQGTVRTAAGQPLAGVEVYADNTLYYNMNALATTDAQGRYRIELPHEVGTWRPGASIKRSWGDQVFKLTVYPNDNSAFSARDGAVRDFVWRIQGKHDGGVLGQPVNVYFGGEGEVDWDTLELTFTPDGPLIDGSRGQPFRRKVTGGKIMDVPIGRYRVAATQIQNGLPVALGVRAEGQDQYAASAVGTFRETLYGIRMEVTVQGR